MDIGPGIHLNVSGERTCRMNEAETDGTVQGIASSLSENNFTPLGQSSQKGDTSIEDESACSIQKTPQTPLSAPEGFCGAART